MPGERSRRTTLAESTDGYSYLSRGRDGTIWSLHPQWEIIDYAHDDKADAPSGTAREPSARLGRIRPAELTVPLEQTQGIVAIRKVTSFVGLRRSLDSVLDLG